MLLFIGPCGGNTGLYVSFLQYQVNPASNVNISTTSSLFGVGPMVGAVGDVQTQLAGQVTVRLPTESCFMKIEVCKYEKDSFNTAGNFLSMVNTTLPVRFNLKAGAVDISIVTAPDPGNVTTSFCEAYFSNVVRSMTDLVSFVFINLPAMDGYMQYLQYIWQCL